VAPSAAWESELTFRVGERHRVSALRVSPPSPRALLVLAHGAGAGMRHAFLAGLAAALAERRIATLRYQFPYAERGERRPDPPALLRATVRGALAEGARAARGLPLLAGGKSMGGRMTSQALAERADPAVRGIVFFGFPLHPAGRPSVERGEHLAAVEAPMLFLQGTRDALADLTLLEPICRKLAPRAALRVIEGADHSFRVPKRSGRSDRDVLEELARATAEWCSAIGVGP
jgi:hypothetical protein